MKDTRNITIIVLSISALVLLAVLVGNMMQPPVAYADASVKGGDYIMANGAVAKGSDFVYVINISARKLIVYFPNRATGKMEIIDGLDLEALFKKN